MNCSLFFRKLPSVYCATRSLIALGWIVAPLGHHSVCYAAPRKASAVRVDSTALTPITLRAEPPIVVQSGRGGAAGVRVMISASVLNRSAYEAKGVSAYLVLRSGIVVPLRGPKRIGAMGRALYVASSHLPYLVTETPTVKATCLNCRSLR